MERLHRLLQVFAEQYAAKQIERQTPAIIEKAFDEWQEWMHFNGHFANASTEFLQAMGEAMQIVKERINAKQ